MLNFRIYPDIGVGFDTRLRVYESVEARNPLDDDSRRDKPDLSADRADLVARIEELETALRARDEFLSVAAHELRNPMHALLLQVTAVRGAAQRGETGLVPRLAQIEKTVDRYVRRASVLLDVSRISAGRLRLDRAAVDFAAVVRETVASFEEEIAFARSVLRVQAPAQLIGAWDQVALEQVVTNLVSNAVKYGAGGPIAVSLAQEGPSARFSVRDEGVGIPAPDLIRVFERFEQVLTQRAPSGFGVGLWLVRELVEAHGGSVDVVSTVGKGSTFTVRLPIEAPSGGSEVTDGL